MVTHIPGTDGVPYQKNNASSSRLPRPKIAAKKMFSSSMLIDTPQPPFVAGAAKQSKA